MVKEKIGTIIKRLRKEKCMSQVELGKLANITLMSISLIETNKVKPNVKTINRIAKALQCDYETLFDALN